MAIGLKLQRSNNKFDIYTKGPGIYWSKEFNRWMCVDKLLIKEILLNENFVVHDYNFQALEKRFKLDLSLISKLLPYIPLAVDGGNHKALRERMVQEIAKNSNNALKIFDAELKKAFSQLNEGEVDLFLSVIKTASIKALCLIAQIDIPIGTEVTTISQIFDDTISVSHRIKINSTLSEILNNLPNNIDMDEKYFRMALLALGTNSFIGSMSESVVTILEEIKTGNFRKINWDLDMPATGVAAIERIVARDSVVLGNIFNEGQRVTLFLDSCGYSKSKWPSYSKLYFGPGKHICPGMKFSLEAWKILRNNFLDFDATFQFKSAEYRVSDCAFNFPISIKVKIEQKN